MFLIIVFIKRFRNIVLVPFIELFGHEHKFETCFQNFCGNDFLKVIWKSLYFIFLKQLIE